MGEKFFVRTFGCQMNEHDSERLAADLTKDGFERTDDLLDADVVVLNTCCIRENADNKLYGHLGHLQSLRAEKPGLRIAVGGCLAQKERERIVDRAPFVDVVFGTHNVGRAGALLEAARRDGAPAIEVLEASAEPDAFPVSLPIRPESTHRAWVTIQVGCDNSCAFCIVPSVRGVEQSRPFGELLREVDDLAKSGTVEVTLLGQNVNSYGRDLATRLRGTAGNDVAWVAGPVFAADPKRRAKPLFADLLRAVGNIDGIRRVRFTSPHPKDLRPETIAAMAETDAVCEQLHLPLQSGSNHVLSEMRRGYRVERYLDRLAAAREAIDDLAVTTDLIVGFPGETDDDFEETLAVVAEARFDSAYTFIFSPRPGTRAAELVDLFVPKEVVAERFARLKVVVDRSSLAAHEARIGRTEEVLVEGVSRKDPAVLAARTRQGKLAHFPPRTQTMAPGSFATVSILGAGPHHLDGELVPA